MKQVEHWYSPAWISTVAFCHLPLHIECEHSRGPLQWNGKPLFWSTSCFFAHRSRCQSFHHSCQLHPCSHLQVGAFSQHCQVCHAFWCWWHLPCGLSKGNKFPFCRWNEQPTCFHAYETCVSPFGRLGVVKVAGSFSRFFLAVPQAAESCSDRYVKKASLVYQLSTYTWYPLPSKFSINLGMTAQHHLNPACWPIADQPHVHLVPCQGKHMNSKGSLISHKDWTFWFQSERASGGYTRVI